MPLLGIGSKKYANRGPKSRAGFNAYPVVAPKDIPIDATKIPMTIGAKPSAIFPKQRIASINKNVAIISDIKLKGLLSMAGPVAKIPTQFPSSGPVTLMQQ